MNKFIKNIKIITRSLKEASTLKKMDQQKHPLLDIVTKSFRASKTDQYNNAEDRGAFNRCEDYRNELLKDETLITYEIFDSNHIATVRDISSNASVTPQWGQFLYYLARFTDQPVVLEIGTNLGVSGSYILEGMGGGDSYFTTMEGLPQLCEISSRQFETIVSQNKFEVIQGLYDDTFPRVINQAKPYNLLFIDGNHQKDPTLEYFYSLKKVSADKAIFVFDDIHWSTGMKEAWNIIKSDADVNYTLDLYRQGIVIVDRNLSSDSKNFYLHLAH